MSIEIHSDLVPKNSGWFPVTQAKFVLGGYFAMPTSASMFAIPNNMRSTGMMVFVHEYGIMYRLEGGITNSDWKAVIPAFSHFQDIPASSWDITHNLRFKPNVIVEDESGNEYKGQVLYTSDDSLSILFNHLLTGYAHLS